MNIKKPQKSNFSKKKTIKKKIKNNKSLKKINSLKHNKKDKFYPNNSVNDKKYKLLVISVNNEKGELRRKFLNYKYKWIKAIYLDDKNNKILKYVRSKVVTRYNTNKNGRKFKGATANISSHLKILNMIVDENLSNVIVLEDDSIQNTKLPKISELPTDSATLFSGQIRHPFSWEEEPAWIKTDLKKVIKSLKNGVNVIDYNKYRWTQCNAIFIPNKNVAKELLNNIDNTKAFKLYYDMLLANNKLIKYLYYPAPFRHDDTLQNVISQVGGVLQGNIENYVLKK